MSQERCYRVYVVELKQPRWRGFGPLEGAMYLTKRRAIIRIQKEIAAAVRQRKTPNEYRVTGYWDQRPW